jgi:outer membrane protein assembly factor BamB
MKRLILILTSLLCLSACESKWLGESNQAKKKLVGERVSVFATPKGLMPDMNLQNVAIHLPARQSNPQWVVSDSAQYEGIPDHIKLGSLEHNESFEKVTGVSDNPIYNKLSSTIRLRNQYLIATPVVVEGRIFVQNSEGKVHAYSAHDQKLLWSKSFTPARAKNEFFGGGMSYGDGKLFVTNGSRDIIAFNPATGNEIWRRTLNNVARSVPVWHDDKLFVTTIDNRLYALSSDDGNALWMNDGASDHIGIFGKAIIAISGDKVIVPYASGQIYALNINDGNQLWAVDLNYNKTNLPGLSAIDLDITPVIRNNVIYVVGNMRDLFALDLHSGRILWHLDIAIDNAFWVAGNYIYTITKDHQIVCIENKIGSIKWIKKLELLDNKGKVKIRKFMGPILVDDQLLISTDRSELLFFSPYDGNLLGQYKTKIHSRLPPIIADNMILLLDEYGKLNILAAR